MLQYKINVLEELKNKNYSTTYIRNNKLLSESTLTKIRNNDISISCETLAALCCMLRCQPGDILENVITDQEKIKYF